MAKREDTTYFEKKLLEFVGTKDPMLEMLQWVMDKFMEIEVSQKTGAEKGERTEKRTGYRSGYRIRRFDTRLGTVYLSVPKIRQGGYIPFFVTEKKRSEQALIQVVQECWLNGVSTRKIEKIAGKLGLESLSASEVSEINKGLDDMKEDKTSWVSFFQWLRSRGLDGVKLIVGDKSLGMLEAVGEVFPEAKYQRCTVHFYRNVFSVTPRSKVKIVAKMLKAIHAQESKKAARQRAKAVAEELRAMKLKEAAKKVEDGIEETLAYCDFPSEHWSRIRTNNVIERLNREIRLRPRVVGSFPDGNCALMLVCARLRHVAGTQWGNKKYMNMKHLEDALEDASIAG